MVQTVHRFTCPDCQFQGGAHGLQVHQAWARHGQFKGKPPRRGPAKAPARETPERKIVPTSRPIRAPAPAETPERKGRVAPLPTAAPTVQAQDALCTIHGQVTLELLGTIAAALGAGEIRACPNGAPGIELLRAG